MRHAGAFLWAPPATECSGLSYLACELGKENAALKSGVGPVLAAACFPTEAQAAAPSMALCHALLQDDTMIPHVGY